MKLSMLLQLYKLQLERALEKKTLYINLKHIFEIVHTHQELQLGIRQSMKVYETFSSTVQFPIVNHLRYCTVYNT